MRFYFWWHRLHQYCIIKFYNYKALYKINVYFTSQILKATFSHLTHHWSTIQSLFGNMMFPIQHKKKEEYLQLIYICDTSYQKCGRKMSKHKKNKKIKKILHSHTGHMILSTGCWLNGGRFECELAIACKKRWGVCGMNDWRSLTYVNRDKYVVWQTNPVLTFWKNYMVKK